MRPLWPTHKRRFCVRRGPRICVHAYASTVTHAHASAMTHAWGTWARLERLDRDEKDPSQAPNTKTKTSTVL
ncbi:hypothetical protein VNO80_22658 [Phaseolus coccineus]|uniref:Uncharacterized protein n=1 Tax=Phaseolus coccineus TaxID=3886 RepID=A0AAN9QUH4_PHACN